MLVTTLALQLEYYHWMFIHNSKNTKPRKLAVFPFSFKKNLEEGCVNKIISYLCLFIGLRIFLNGKTIMLSLSVSISPKFLKTLTDFQNIWCERNIIWHSDAWRFHFPQSVKTCQSCKGVRQEQHLLLVITCWSYIFA